MEEVVTENNPGLGSAWPKDRAPERGGEELETCEGRTEASPLAPARRALCPRGLNFLPASNFCSHSVCHTWNSLMATSPKRPVCRVDRLVGTEEPGQGCGSALERGTSLSGACAP